MTERPTRIIAKPFLISGKKKDGLAIPCDNGKTYETGELARCIVGITPSSLLGRLKRCGWRHPHILDHNMPRKKKSRCEVHGLRLEMTGLKPVR